MNNIQIFKSEEFGQIRTVDINNEIWFVGNDVAKALGYSRTQDALEKHVDEDDSAKHGVTDSLGRVQQTTIINESGLYSLIMGSRLENAKKFKKWITSEVIPSIRKNGGYLAGQENMTPEQIVANALIVANNIIADKDKQIEEMQPKADYFDALVERNLLSNFTDTAKQLGIKRQEFIGYLMENGYIYKKPNGEYRSYSSKDKGLFELRDYKANRSDHTGKQLMITPKGKITFKLLICGEERE